MSTAQLEVLRREALEEEKEEIERIRKKYKERQKQLQHQKDSNTLDQEKQALIEEAEQQEQQEKEQIRQKYKQRQKQGQLNTTHHTNPEIQALIEEAEQQEQQEKEQIRQKLKQRQKQRKQKNTTNQQKALVQQAEQRKKEQIKTITTRSLEKEDLYKRALNKEVIETDDNILEVFLEKKSNQDTKSFNQLGKTHGDELESYGLENENLETEELNRDNEELETVDRSALLAKYNINDIQEDDINNLLENFDRSITDENVEEIEERLMETIKQSTLSHPKIEWANVLVFLDEEEVEGNIKIFAEYDDKSLLKRIISDNNKKLEVELIQIALYEVWDVFTTLGVNTNDLESKIEVEVELDRA